MRRELKVTVVRAMIKGESRFRKPEKLISNSMLIKVARLNYWFW